MHTAYIGIGSNLSDKLANCERAVSMLGEHCGVTVCVLSKWYETVSVPPGQPDYVNGVAMVETELTPFELFAVQQKIEVRLGREPLHPKGLPRTIDLDLLFYDDLVIHSDGLEVPHPEVAKRLFVLVPLCDIAPLLVHPGIGRTIHELKMELESDETMKGQWQCSG